MYSMYCAYMARRPIRPREPRRVVTASEAVRNFAGLVERVREERAAYVVERAGRPVVVVVPPDTRACTLRDLAAWLRGRPALDAAYLDEVEAAVRSFNRPAVPGDPWER